MIERTFPTQSTKRGTTVTMIGWRIPTPDKPGPASALFTVKYKDGKVAERVWLSALTGTLEPDPKRWRPINVRSRAGLSQAMELARGAWASGTAQEAPDYVFGWARPGFFSSLS